MRARAFAPGHITGFFIPYMNEDPIKSGSRGAGICLSRGAVAELEISEGKGIEIEGVDGEVTERALSIAKEELGIKGRISVKIELQLPQSQGFGMSAAGTLAASFALASIYGVNDFNALRWTHIAEVESRTGLSDAIASYHGGLVIRKMPGLPPYGEIEKVETEGKIKCIVLGEEIHTEEILSDRKMMERVRMYGKKAMESFMEDKSLENFMRVGREFASSLRISDILENIPEGKAGSQAMLGNSVFFIDGDDDGMECRIDNMGARVLG